MLVLASILIVLLELLSVGMVIPLIGIMLNPEKIIIQIEKYFPDFYFLKNFLNLELSSYLIYFLILFFSIFLIKNFLIFIYFYYQNKFVQNIEANLARRLLEKYFSQKYSFVNNNSSILISKLTADLLTFTRGYGTSNNFDI